MHNVMKEEIELARNVDTVELIQRLGIPLVKSGGNEYRMVDHDSFTVSRTKGWYWNSRGRGGDAIQFLMEYPDYQYSFVGAVSKILSVMGYGMPDILIHNPQKTAEKSAVLRLPVPFQDNKRVIAYLCQKRGIDYEIVKQCIQQKRLYESENHNAVFVGFDDTGQGRYAFQRGTTDKRWAGEVEGSDKRFSFCLRGKISELHVFEAAIDVLSFVTLQPNCAGHCLSLGGVSLLGLDYFLTKHTVQVIYVHTDNDNTGRGCYRAVYSKYVDSIPVIPSLPQHGKDWNDQLLYKRNGENYEPISDA